MRRKIFRGPYVLTITWVVCLLFVLGGVMTGPVLGSVLFATSGVEPLVIGAAAVFLGVGALIASYLPARRALRTDPVAALRAQ